MHAETVPSSESPRLQEPPLKDRAVPGPPDWQVGRYTYDLLYDPLNMLLRGHEQYGPIARYLFGPQRYWMVNDVEAVRRVLVENSKAYEKSQNYVGLRLVLGDGLVTSEGELHKRQRRLANPAFHHRSIEGFIPTFDRHTERMLSRWGARGPGHIDVHREMMALTLKIVGECLFGANLDGEAHRFGDAVEVLLHFANDYALTYPRMPLWLPTPRRIAFRRALATVDEAVSTVIAARHARVAAGGDAGADLLGAFLRAHDEDGSSMTDKQLRDEVVTMLAAGHETTANALSFTLHLLSRHPETERAVAAEVLSVLGNAELTPAHLPQLALCERVIKESMRLYPPVWMIERENTEPDVVGGYALKAGTTVGISPWVLHRDPKIWENPEGFDPDRFLPGAESRRPRYAYLPFGAGPRVCIGASFAMTEAKAILALIVRRARLSAVPGHDLALDPNVTLRPKGALTMALSMRPRSAAQGS